MEREQEPKILFRYIVPFGPYGVRSSVEVELYRGSTKGSYLLKVTVYNPEGAIESTQTTGLTVI